MMKPVLVVLAMVSGVAALPVQAFPGGGGGEGRPSFSEIDGNGDGMLTQAEIDAFQVARMAAMNTNGDQALTAAEVADYLKKEAAARLEQRARHMVAQFDTDGDGQVTAAEWAADPRPQRMIDRMDRDGDGQISKAEFGKGGPGRGRGRDCAKGMGEGCEMPEGGN